MALEVALGDVSLNKVSFLIAADAGIYASNGLDVHQFITPGAAQVARNSGVIVPAQYVQVRYRQRADLHRWWQPDDLSRRQRCGRRSSHGTSDDTEGIVRDHIIASKAIARVEDLKGKRLGYSVPGAVTHVGGAWIRQAHGLGPGADISLSATATRSIR